MQFRPFTKKLRPGTSRTGSAVVELSLVLPVLIMVILGIVEFGRALMVSQLITNAARDGVRRAILDGSTNVVVNASIKDFLQDAAGVQNGHVTVAITITPAPGNNDPGNQLSKAQSGDTVDIHVEVPFDKVSYIAGNYLSGKNLVGQASMRHE